MCVCVFVCVCACVYVFVRVCVYAYVYVYSNAYVYVYAYMYVCMHTYACLHHCSHHQLPTSNSRKNAAAKDTNKFQACKSHVKFAALDP